MRRENRKKSKSSSNTTIFVTGGILLIASATFVITFIVYSNKLDNDLYIVLNNLNQKNTNHYLTYLNKQ